jgi:uncharacterized membrane protein
MLDPPRRLGQGRRAFLNRRILMISTPPPATGKPASAPVLVWLGRHRPRLLIAAALIAIVYLATPGIFREATRALIAWNVGAWAFLAMIALMVARERGDLVRRHAAAEDENEWALMLLAIIAAAAAIAAILWELGPVKDMAGLSKAFHIALVAATLLSAWAFIHVMFALHYAGAYYSPKAGAIRGGLKFPETQDPSWSDFFYQAFVIGCACATADVNTTTKGMRSICAIHGVVAFFFNTIILALTINIGAGFI